MKKIFLLSLAFLALGCSSNMFAKTNLKSKGKNMPLAQIKLSDYGAVKDGSVNAKDAFKAALDACRAKGNCELVIDPGVYLISDPEAIKLRDAVMSLKDKSQDEGTIFQFYFPYVTGLDMRNLKNVKVQTFLRIELCRTKPLHLTLALGLRRPKPLAVCRRSQAF